MRWWASALALVAVVEAISYRCENDQVLIVQSFGNDTIRMHCQKLNLCGFKNLKCNYDREQPSCGGKHNFVSHVNQITATGPVSHTCCELQHDNDPDIASHAGNDCFVYELPDGSTDSEKARNRKAHSVDWNEQLTVLQNINQVPEHVDSEASGNVGYRMRLFMLRNKSPPSLIVKAIERLPEGYRVTICRPRCGNFDREGEVNTKEKTDSTKNGDILHGKVRSPAEWAAASWSSWSSSTWSSWSTTRYVGDESEASSASGSKGRGTVRGDRTLIPVEGETVSASASAAGPPTSGGDGADGANGGAGGASGVTNNFNVKAEGGAGGAGGQGGVGHGGSVHGIAPSGGTSVAAANGTGVGVGAAGEGGAGKPSPDSGDGANNGGENGALEGGSNGNGVGDGNGDGKDPKTSKSGPDGTGNGNGDNG
uniref:Uncharacterized protein n=1 Tax=Panagrellus redivivus TaxID=6233 RepID=A0A7E5A134_PANRE